MRHQIFDATPVWSQEGIDSGDLTTENDGIPENAKGENNSSQVNSPGYLHPSPGQMSTDSGFMSDTSQPLQTNPELQLNNDTPGMVVHANPNDWADSNFTNEELSDLVDQMFSSMSTSKQWSDSVISELTGLAEECMTTFSGQGLCQNCTSMEGNPEKSCQNCGHYSQQQQQHHHQTKEIAEQKEDDTKEEERVQAQRNRICTVHPAVRNVGVVEPRVVVKISWAKIKSKTEKALEEPDRSCGVSPSSKQPHTMSVGSERESGWKLKRKNDVVQHYSITQKLPEHFRQALEKRCMDGASNQEHKLAKANNILKRKHKEIEMEDDSNVSNKSESLQNVNHSPKNKEVFNFCKKNRDMEKSMKINLPERNSKKCLINSKPLQIAKCPPLNSIEGAGFSRYLDTCLDFGDLARASNYRSQSLFQTSDLMKLRLMGNEDKKISRQNLKTQTKQKLGGKSDNLKSPNLSSTNCQLVKDVQPVLSTITLHSKALDVPESYLPLKPYVSLPMVPMVPLASTISQFSTTTSSISNSQLNKVIYKSDKKMTTRAGGKSVRKISKTSNCANSSREENVRKHVEVPKSALNRNNVTKWKDCNEGGSKYRPNVEGVVTSTTLSSTDKASLISYEPRFSYIQAKSSTATKKNHSKQAQMDNLNQELSGSISATIKNLSSANFLSSSTTQHIKPFPSIMSLNGKPMDSAECHAQTKPHVSLPNIPMIVQASNLSSSKSVIPNSQYNKVIYKSERKVFKTGSKSCRKISKPSSCRESHGAGNTDLFSGLLSINGQYHIGSVVTSTSSSMEFKTSVINPRSKDKICKAERQSCQNLSKYVTLKDNVDLIQSETHLDKTNYVNTNSNCNKKQSPVSVKFVEEKEADTKWLYCSEPDCHFWTKKQIRMARHKQCHSVDEDNKPIFSCPDCRVKIATLAKLLKHDRKFHTGFKDYECKICEAEVTDIGAHMKIHKSENEFSCTSCGIQFQHRNSYVRHLLHHSDRQSRCHACGLDFLSPKRFQDHIRKKHPSNKPTQPLRSYAPIAPAPPKQRTDFPMTPLIQVPVTTAPRPQATTLLLPQQIQPQQFIMNSKTLYVMNSQPTYHQPVLVGLTQPQSQPFFINSPQISTFLQEASSGSYLLSSQGLMSGQHPVFLSANHVSTTSIGFPVTHLTSSNGSIASSCAPVLGPKPPRIL